MNSKYLKMILIFYNSKNTLKLGMRNSLKHLIKLSNQKVLWLSSVQGIMQEFLNLTKSYNRYGFQVSDLGVYYRECAPTAKAVSIFGDFNNYDK